MTQLGSLPSVGSAVGVVESVDSGLGVAPSVGSGVGVGVVAADVAANSAKMTGRNSSLAELWMRSSVSSSGSPGIETTMLESPCVVISASETPLASMRSRMIDMSGESF